MNIMSTVINLFLQKKKNDFVKWDNFDDRWNVSTRPNHFHSRYNKGVLKSQMIGQPSKDMQILISYILENL